MKNDFILLELNHRNEIRADVNMTIKSLDITRIGQINVKIDTGCPYTSIPVRKLGISNEKARLMKQADCADSSIKKESCLPFLPSPNLNNPELEFCSFAQDRIIKRLYTMAGRIPYVP